MVEKARQWFGRATTADPDNGDIWAWWWLFEKEQGTKEHQDAVANKCAVAEPHHAPVWQEVAKNVKNVGKDNKKILELVAITLKKDVKQ